MLERLRASKSFWKNEALKHLGEECKTDEIVKKFLDKPELKIKKDPDKPKRPKSAFLLFCDDERQKLIEKQKKGLKKDDKFSLGSVQKKLGEQWNNLNTDKKKKYIDKCECIKEQYYDKMSEYESQLEQ